MKPRLETSKKWSSLPDELLVQIKDIFNENFSKKLGTSTVLTEGRIYTNEIVLRVGLNAPERIKQHNFEASMAYDKSKDNVMALVHVAVDCAGSMLAEFLENENTEFPHEWHKYDVENKEVFLKYSTDNSTLESEANKLLGLASEGLVKGEDPAKDIETMKKIIGIDEE